jgi:hypothetical protein
MMFVDVQNSLLSANAPLIGSNNLRGDPLFTNPVANDFSLMAGSPAIDAGSNSAVNLPFKDHYEKYRVASPGAGPGEGIVDIGAVESGSTYPQIYPLVVDGFNSTINDRYTTGVTILNSSSSPASPVFSAYNAGGVLIAGSNNPTRAGQVLLSPSAQLSLFGWQLFGSPSTSDVVAGVLGSSTQKFTGFFLVFDTLLAKLADGVDVSSDTANQFLFLHHQNDSSALRIRFIAVWNSRRGYGSRLCCCGQQC